MELVKVADERKRWRTWWSSWSVVSFVCVGNEENNGDDYRQ